MLMIPYGLVLKRANKVPKTGSFKAVARLVSAIEVKEKIYR